MLQPAPHQFPSAPHRLLDSRQTLTPAPPPPNALTAKLPPFYHLTTGCRLAQLYSICFSDETAWRALVVDWHDEAAVIGAIQTFLEKVDAELFAVCEEFGWSGDLRESEWALYNIPIMAYGFDVWYEEVEAYREPLPFLHYLCNVRGSAYYHDEALASEYSELDIPADLEPVRLVNTLKQMTRPQPLDALPHLIQMLAMDTGNIFLDAGDLTLSDSQGYPLWNRENVLWLTQQWQEAKPILSKVQAVWAWEAEDAEKLTAVRDVLLEAYALQQKEQANEQST